MTGSDTQEGLAGATSAVPLASVRRYFVGLLLALVMTGTAFGIVVWGGWQAATAMTVIVVLAVAQTLVHLVFFLNLGRQRTPVEIRAALLLAVVLIAIMVGGTLVIMSDLSHRMAAH